jgi:hypothetical protein
MTYQDLKNKLDRLFAAYIRMRDKDKPCISCGKYTDDKEAGHFYSRKNLAVRWDEFNVHGQCIECNRYRNGNMVAFGRGIALRYGEDVVDKLDRKSQERVKLKSYELLEKIDLYQNKLKNLSEK